MSNESDDYWRGYDEGYDDGFSDRDETKFEPYFGVIPLGAALVILVLLILLR